VNRDSTHALAVGRTALIGYVFWHSFYVVGSKGRFRS
jgi:hypothetical protein